MGQGSSHHSRGRRSLKRGGVGGSNRTPSPNYDLPPLRFHLKHGDNIVLSADKSRAVRAESFCKGIVFSNRPVMVGERVCIRLTDLSDRWNGLLRVGFSAHDPVSLCTPLPKYACPDLTSKDGFWAKALSERCVTTVDTRIHYCVSANGDVHFGFNGQDLGVFFSGVDTRTPLWAMIDLYGNCTSIEFQDLRRNMNNYRAGEPAPDDDDISRNFEQQLELNQQQLDPAVPAAGSHHQPLPSQYHQMPPPPPAASAAAVAANPVPATQLTVQLPPPVPPQQPARHLNGSVSASNLQQQQPVQRNRGTASTTYNDLRAHNGVRFTPLSFHPGAGRHAQIVDNVTACRHKDEFSQGYVFAWPHTRIGERIVVQVVSTEVSYIGSLAFGLTNCDPSTIDVRELPEDSDLLLDRPEYWVVSKDVANNPEVGDELSFMINADGSVEFSKNGNIPSTFMHVDTSLPLWAFWDIYGNTSKIRLLGSTTDSLIRNSTSSLPAQPFNNSTGARPEPSGTTGAPATGAGAAPTELNSSFGSNGPGECTVCYENVVDCVLYQCGHMCMCYECALQQWKGRGQGFCPICRSPIRDVIKTFRS